MGLLISQYFWNSSHSHAVDIRRYTDLAALIDPSKAPKTDRNLILEDAVRVIGQLRVENNQLRQLNKLLEERVQEQEAKRGHALYQQSVMMQGGLNPSPRADGASTSRGTAVHGLPQFTVLVCLFHRRCLISVAVPYTWRFMGAVQVFLKLVDLHLM